MHTAVIAVINTLVIRNSKLKRSLLVIADKTLKLEWRESGGPPVLVPPRHRGFGLQLLSSALDQSAGPLRRFLRIPG
jgi:two-component sensor histidine kinase